MNDAEMQATKAKYAGMSKEGLKEHIRESMEDLEYALLELATREDAEDTIKFFNELNLGPNKELARKIMEVFHANGVPHAVTAAVVGRSQSAVKEAVSQMSKSVSNLTETDKSDIDNSEPINDLPVLGKPHNPDTVPKVNDSKTWKGGIEGLTQQISSMELIARTYPNPSIRQRKETLKELDQLTERILALKKMIEESL